MKRLFLPIFLAAFVVSASGQDTRDHTARITSIAKLSATTNGDRGTFSADYRRNTNFDKTFPGNEEYDGFVFGLTYTQPVEPLSANNAPVVVWEAESESVSAGGSLEITARAFDADSELLTFAWTSTAGAIDGTDESITFSSAGLAPVQYVVRVVVTDVRDGSAQAELTITVE